jgi:ubiquinone/menaquinone biosynthesis C-methylase UbiE
VEIFGDLDYPSDKLRVTRGMKLEGWAFATSGEELEIEIYLDKHYIKKIHCGIPRFDIETKFPNYKNEAYVSGFLTRLAMPKKSVVHYHTLEVIAKVGDYSKSIAKIKVNLDTTNSVIERESWPDQGMTINFREGGETVFNQMLSLCNLKSDFQILDLGCQLGRLAIPFSKFLIKKGSYDGVDIIPEAIEWTKKHIESKYPNFHFTLADVYNGWYNPKGKIKSYEYKLPFDDSNFDFVIMISVFTHMLEDDLENYFSEVSRILKPGGLVWMTFYLINDETKKLLNLKSTNIDFKYKYEPGYWSIRNDYPESSVAWDEEIIKKHCKKNALKIKLPIHYGSWRYASGEFLKQNSALSIQDVLILEKEE